MGYSSLSSLGHPVTPYFPDLRFTLSPGSNATSTEESSNFESCSNKHFSSLFNIDPSIYGFTKSRRRRSRKNKIDSSSRPSTRDRVECTEEDEEPAYCYHYWCETTPAITTYQVIQDTKTIFPEETFTRDPNLFSVFWWLHHRVYRLPLVPSTDAGDFQQGPGAEATGRQHIAFEKKSKITLKLTM